jgi:hypothetical protein
MDCMPSRRRQSANERMPCNAPEPQTAPQLNLPHLLLASPSTRQRRVLLDLTRLICTLHRAKFTRLHQELTDLSDQVGVPCRCLMSVSPRAITR